MGMGGWRHDSGLVGELLYANHSYQYLPLVTKIKGTVQLLVNPLVDHLSAVIGCGAATQSLEDGTGTVKLWIKCVPCPMITFW